MSSTAGLTALSGRSATASSSSVSTASSPAAPTTIDALSAESVPDVTASANSSDFDIASPSAVAERFLRADVPVSFASHSAVSRAAGADECAGGIGRVGRAADVRVELRLGLLQLDQQRPPFGQIDGIEVRRTEPVDSRDHGSNSVGEAHGVIVSNIRSSVNGRERLFDAAAHCWRITRSSPAVLTWSPVVSPGAAR